MTGFFVGEATFSRGRPWGGESGGRAARCRVFISCSGAFRLHSRPEHGGNRTAKGGERGRVLRAPRGGTNKAFRGRQALPPLVARDWTIALRGDGMRPSRFQGTRCIGCSFDSRRRIPDHRAPRSRCTPYAGNAAQSMRKYQLTLLAPSR